MVEAAVMEPRHAHHGNGNGHHHEGIEQVNINESSKASKALVSIWNYTLKKLMEFTSDDVIEDKPGCKRVLKIATDIGNMVLGDETIDDIAKPLAAIIDAQDETRENGNGHAKPKAKKPQPTKQQPKNINFPKTLSPQELKFCKFLHENKGKGYIKSDTICKHLGINHLGSLVTKVRQKGVPVASAHTDRQNGKNIPDTAQGFMLSMN